MKKEFTEKDYFLHPYPYTEVLKMLKEEISRIEKSGKKSLWFYSGKHTLARLEKGKELLLKKGRKGEISLTPYDVNNVVYVLLRKLGAVK